MSPLYPIIRTDVDILFSSQLSRDISITLKIMTLTFTFSHSRHFTPLSLLPICVTISRVALQASQGTQTYLQYSDRVKAGRLTNKDSIPEIWR
jgi:hypothetical protein